MQPVQPLRIRPQDNARLLVTPGAASLDQYGYTGFGMELGTGAAQANPFRFGGQYGYYRDDPFRLYVRARHYSPDKGRWLSPDPLVMPSNYPYADNCPFTSNDPSGLQRRSTSNYGKYAPFGEELAALTWAGINPDDSLSEERNITFKWLRRINEFGDARYENFRNPDVQKLWRDLWLFKALRDTHGDIARSYGIRNSEMAAHGIPLSGADVSAASPRIDRMFIFTDESLRQAQQKLETASYIPFVGEATSLAAFGIAVVRGDKESAIIMVAMYPREYFSCHKRKEI